MCGAVSCDVCRKDYRSKGGLIYYIRTVHVLSTARSMISKGSLVIIKVLFMKKDSPTVMCAGTSTEVKKTLEVI